MFNEIFLVIYYHNFNGEEKTEIYPYFKLESAQNKLSEIKTDLFTRLSINDADKNLEENDINNVVYYGNFMRAEISIEKKEIH